MCPIFDGQAVDAANSNPAWLDAQTDDVALGKIGLENTDPVSGKYVANTQRYLNNIGTTIGLDTSGNYVAEADPNGRTYSATPNTINDGDSHKLALSTLANKFDPSTGHAHSGAAGDGAPIVAANLSSVPLRGYFLQGLDLSSVSGGSWDVSTEMTGKTASAGITSEGVVVTAPYNKVVLKNSAGDSFEDGSGNTVYARLTEAAGVWTLTFYVDISGTETAYSFVSPEDVTWYFQELFNPMVNPPVYSELAIIPSDNPTQDVATATTGLQGKVLLSSTAPSAIAATGAAGTANATVANADHTHEGVHALLKDGDLTQLLGNVKLKEGQNITLTVDSLNNLIEIAATVTGVGYQEVPTGVVNGSNTTFGPLTYVPTNADSILVFVDGLQVDKTDWSLVGLSIVFGTAPSLGQKVYVFYLTEGTPAPPPVISGIWKTEYRVLTAGEVTAGSLTLAQTPAAPSEVMVDAIGGTAQEYATDFSVVGTTLSWSGLGLDGVLSAGDKLRIGYVY